MFCTRCGNNLSDSDAFCSNCGADMRSKNINVENDNFNKGECNREYINNQNANSEYIKGNNEVKITGLLVWSIIEILLCFSFIPGLIALILWSVQLKTAVTIGDEIKIKEAKRDVKIALWIGVALLIPIVIFFTAGSIISALKTPIVGNEFYNLLKDDYSVNIIEESEVGVHYVAYNENYTIEFVECSSENYAGSIYADITSKFKESKGNSFSFYFNDYGKYSSESKGQYSIISRIDNTIMLAQTDSMHKEEVKSVFKKLGY